MKIMNHWVRLFVLYVVGCNSISLFAFCGCNYIKTHQRNTRGAVPQKQNHVVASGVLAKKKKNNWITHEQMEARREEKWQAQQKRVRDRKNEAQALVAE